MPAAEREKVVAKDMPAGMGAKAWPAAAMGPVGARAVRAAVGQPWMPAAVHNSRTRRTFSGCPPCLRCTRHHRKRSRRQWWSTSCCLSGSAGRRSRQYCRSRTARTCYLKSARGSPSGCPCTSLRGLSRTRRRRRRGPMPCSQRGTTRGSLDRCRYRQRSSRGTDGAGSSSRHSFPPSIQTKVRLGPPSLRGR